DLRIHALLRGDPSARHAVVAGLLGPGPRSPADQLRGAAQGTPGDRSTEPAHAARGEAFDVRLGVGPGLQWRFRRTDRPLPGVSECGALGSAEGEPQGVRTTPWNAVPSYARSRGAVPRPGASTRPTRAKQTRAAAWMTWNTSLWLKARPSPRWRSCTAAPAAESRIPAPIHPAPGARRAPSQAASPPRPTRLRPK